MRNRLFVRLEIQVKFTPWMKAQGKLFIGIPLVMRDHRISLFTINGNADINTIPFECIQQ